MSKLWAMPIPWLILGHIQKLGLKWDKRKEKLQKLNDSASNKIEMKLMKELANVESLIDVQLYNRVSVQLSNNWCLVANLSSRECNCSWWQTQGFPCWHAMVVIKKEKKWM